MTNYYEKYEELLIHVAKPSRYSGGEFNSYNPFPSKVKFCLCFPDVYEVAISNLGNKIIYHMINDTEGLSCERCYSPWADMASLLREKNLPLFSLETRTPLGEFDLLGMSLSYEMCYTNVLDMLNLSGIPLKAKDRDESHPLVFAGGVCAVNVEPMHEFFDFVVLGEGEVNLIPVIKFMEKAKDLGMSKMEILKEVDKFSFAYVPSLHQEVFENGKFVGLSNDAKMVKAVAADMDKAYFPTKQIVPNMQAVHDRSVLEVFRGCPRGCRFCQASFCYRPIRAKNPETLIAQCENSIKETGFDEISLSSLSTGDYPRIVEVIKGMTAFTKAKKVKMSLPSLRLDSFDEDFVRDMKKTTSLTFAPEAGTQRLRNVINKNITEEEFENAMEQAFLQGYKSVKLYFMIGLPTETDEDLAGIFEMAKKVKEIYRRVKNRRDVNIQCSVANFVPKPFTPFQWEAQNTQEEFTRKHKLLREMFFRSGYSLKYHDSFTSVLEGIMALGGREVSKLILKAYEKGCNFDGWTECFRADLWQEAILETGIDVEKITGGYAFDQVLPWHYVDVGVNESFFKNENLLAKKSAVTGDCMEKCLGCGANKLSECKTCW